MGQIEGDDMTGLARYALAVAAGLAAMAAWSALNVQKGVQKERDRVTRTEHKIDEKIVKARRAAAAARRPDVGVLDRWSTD